MPELKTVKIEEVVMLPDVQIRCRISSKTVDSYAEQIHEGVEFPPIDVFLDAEKRYIIGDGAHRFLASQKNEAEKIRITIHECKPEEALSRALELSVLQNAKHGLFLSREDRRNAIKKLLSDPMFRRKGDSPLAKMVGVSGGTVAEVRREMAGEDTKKKRVSVGAHKRSAPSSSTENDPNYDPLKERLTQLQNWVDSGLIEWKDVQNIFATASHIPMLVPKAPHHIVIEMDDKQTRVNIESMKVARSGSEQILVFRKPKKEAAEA